MYFRYRESLIFIVWPQLECIEDDGVRVTPKIKELIKFTQNMTTIVKSYNISFVVIDVLDLEERVKLVLDKVSMVKPSIINA